ncbi:hypothetical protein JK636_22795 [Clostridium sp. YIM B02515]|uniref:DUF4314 domain-containing protein n=1 Tax=Clostridium rhizosphaerae TaxID=2803861 RepID=A0ABS1TGN1_9CLOT|nr:hypothetical protein [Clostridium rhizosphaerae]MBL4938536.1 hypothetical protein [Clostridium rhizosphaerae]
MFKYRCLCIAKDDKFYGFVGTPTEILTAYGEELCVGDTVEYFFVGDNHDIMSGLITEVNGNFNIDGRYTTSGLNITRIIRHYMDLKPGDKLAYGLFKVKRYQENNDSINKE